MITDKITQADLEKLDNAALLKLHTTVSIPMPEDKSSPSLVQNILGHVNGLSTARSFGPNYTVTVKNGNARAVSNASVSNPVGCKTCGN